MFKNYFLIATRNLAKNKFFTIINVFCLALGMSLNLLFINLLLFAHSYDDFHTYKDSVYRVTTQLHDNKENPKYATAPVGLIPELENIAGIEKAIPVQRTLNGKAVYSGKELSLNGYFVDPQFLETFSFPLVQGDPSSALNGPNTVVLTKVMATKIFGDKEPMGEIINIDPLGDFIISGIMEDIPANSHMHFDALGSFSTLQAAAGGTFAVSEESWMDFTSNYIYLFLPETTDLATIENSLNELAKEKYGQTNDVQASFELQSLKNIVPGPDLAYSIGPKWSYTDLFIIGLLTLLIIVPAGSNYVNLSIAQSLNRMKEIGVRKVMGGSKRQIFLQFIMETTVMMFLASVLSYFIFELIREEAVNFIGNPAILSLSTSFYSIIYFILFTLFMGFAAGFVPALYFSKIIPVNALKGKLPVKGKNRFPMQKIVIAAQFVLSIGFVMAVVIIIQQYRYSVNYNFEFEQEKILNLEFQDMDKELVKNEYSKLADVKEISMSSGLLGIGPAHPGYFTKALGKDSIAASYLSIDENFIPNLNLKLIAGNNFTDEPGKNRSYIIVNEEFIKKLNITEPVNALGKGVFLSNGREVIINGVVKNFHYSNLMDPIESFYFTYEPDQFKFANLLVTSQDAFKDNTRMEAIWKNIGGTNEYKAEFFDDQINEVYGFYFEIMRLWGFIGLLAITVACLGLLGMVVFTVKNRLKEVSIRKVLGASPKSLIIALSKDYIKLMVIASLIAIPATFFLFANLLPELQYYSLDIGITEVLVSLVIVAVLGLATILSQTLKAAHTNPIHNLKDE